MEDTVIKDLANLTDKLDYTPHEITDAVALIGAQGREIAELKQQLEFKKDQLEKSLERCAALEDVYNDVKKQLAERDKRRGISYYPASSH